jgi:hypothetical protein
MVVEVGFSDKPEGRNRISKFPSKNTTPTVKRGMGRGLMELSVVKILIVFDDWLC